VKLISIETLHELHDAEDMMSVMCTHVTAARAGGIGNATFDNVLLIELVSFKSNILKVRTTVE